MKNKFKILLSTVVIVISIAIVSLCSLFVAKNNHRSSGDNQEIFDNAESSVSDVVEQIYLADLSFVGNVTHLTLGENVELNLENCSFSDGGEASVPAIKVSDGSVVNLKNCSIVWDNETRTQNLIGSVSDNSSWEDNVAYSLNFSGSETHFEALIDNNGNYDSFFNPTITFDGGVIDKNANINLQGDFSADICVDMLEGQVYIDQGIGYISGKSSESEISQGALIECGDASLFVSNMIFNGDLISNHGYGCLYFDNVLYSKDFDMGVPINAVESFQNRHFSFHDTTFAGRVVDTMCNMTFTGETIVPTLVHESVCELMIGTPEDAFTGEVLDFEMDISNPNTYGHIFFNGGTDEDNLGLIDDYIDTYQCCGFSMSGGIVSGYVDSCYSINISGGYVYGCVSPWDEGGCLNMTGGQIYGLRVYYLASASVCGNAVIVSGILVENQSSLFVGENAIIHGTGVECLNSTFEMFGGTIENCSSSSNGGGVRLINSDFTMSGGTIKNNVTESTNRYGGNLYVDKDSSFEMIGGIIAGDGETIQAVRGGGIYSIGTLTLKGGTIENNVSSNYAGGIWVEDSNLELSGVVLSKNKTSTSGNGGQIYAKGERSRIDMTAGEITSDTDVILSKFGSALYNNGIFNFSGGTIEGCYADSSGGAIYNSNTGVIIISGSALFSKNRAKSSGGAIRNNGRVEMSGGVIDGCLLSFNHSGGAIYNYSNSTFIMTGGTIRNFASKKDGSAIFNAGTVTISSNASLINNSTPMNGGHIYNESVLNISDVTITDGRAQNGGAIYNKGTATLSGVTISNCEATLNGGGIYNTNELNVTSKVNIVECNADNFGGGVYYITENYEMPEVFSTVVDNVYVSYCSALYGGGVYLNAVYNTYKFYVSNCEAEDGGGIYARLSDASIDGEYKNNKATYGAGVYVVGDFSTPAGISGNISENSANSGGGIYAKYGIVLIYTNPSSNVAELNGGQIFIDESVEFYLCENMKGNGQVVAQNGGAIYCKGNIKISSYDITISNMKATNGGALYLDGGVVEVLNSTDLNIKSNSATLGGGVYVSNNGKFICNGAYDVVNISNNTATLGGGVYVSSGTFAIDHSKFSISSNNVVNGGRGLNAFVASDAVFELRSGEILDDGKTVRTEPGVGIYNEGSTRLLGGSISNIVSSSDGSAIYNIATLELVDGVIENCSTSLNGGAIYSTSTISLAGATIKNCSAQNGGAIYSNGTIEMSDGKIDGCTATVNAGAVYIAKGSMVVSGGSFENNTAHATSGSGGAIYVAKSTKLTMDGGVISGDLQTVNANSGGGIYNAGTTYLNGGKIVDLVANVYGGGVSSFGTLHIDGINIGACTSNDRGGGVFVGNNSKNYFKSGIIGEFEDSSKSYDGNTANRGGGIMVQGTGKFYMSGGTLNKNILQITNNQAKGGNVHVMTTNAESDDKSSLFHMTGGSINGDPQKQNASDGAGIYNNGITIIDSSNAIITSGYAIRGGGIYNTGKLTINNGKIENNFANSGGGLYNYDNGKIYLNGGSVSNNRSTNHGAGIYSTIKNAETSDPYIEINGAAINNNRIDADPVNSFNCGHGGGIMFYAGTCKMTAGTISGNTISEDAVEPYGAGIYVTNTATFEFVGGVIANNIIEAEYSFGGNVVVNSLASIYMYDDALICGDGSTRQARYGGGIYVSGVVQIHGGTIQNCVADYGSGIMNLPTANERKQFLFDNGSIVGCNSLYGAAIMTFDLITLGSGAVCDGGISLGSNTSGPNEDYIISVENADGSISEYLYPRRTASIKMDSEMTVDSVFSIELFEYELDIQTFDYLVDFNVENMLIHYLKDYSITTESGEVIEARNEAILYGDHADITKFTLPDGFYFYEIDGQGYGLSYDKNIFEITLVLHEETKTIKVAEGSIINITRNTINVPAFTGQVLTFSEIDYYYEDRQECFMYFIDSSFNVFDSEIEVVGDMEIISSYEVVPYPEYTLTLDLPSGVEEYSVYQSQSINIDGNQISFKTSDGEYITRTAIKNIGGVDAQFIGYFDVETDTEKSSFEMLQDISLIAKFRFVSLTIALHDQDPQVHIVESGTNIIRTGSNRFVFVDAFGEEIEVIEDIRYDTDGYAWIFEYFYFESEDQPFDNYDEIIINNDDVISSSYCSNVIHILNIYCSNCSYHSLDYALIEGELIQYDQVQGILCISGNEVIIDFHHDYASKSMKYSDGTNFVEAYIYEDLELYLTYYYQVEVFHPNELSHDYILPYGTKVVFEENSYSFVCQNDSSVNRTEYVIFDYMHQVFDGCYIAEGSIRSSSGLDIEYDYLCISAEYTIIGNACIIYCVNEYVVQSTIIINNNIDEFIFNLYGDDLMTMVIEENKIKINGQVITEKVGYPYTFDFWCAGSEFTLGGIKYFGGDQINEGSYTIEATDAQNISIFAQSSVTESCVFKIHEYSISGASGENYEYMTKTLAFNHEIRIEFDRWDNGITIREFTFNDNGVQVLINSYTIYSQYGLVEYVILNGEVYYSTFEIEDCLASNEINLYIYAGAS